MGMQQNTGVPKSIIDTITAVFIIIATMELLSQIKIKRKRRKQLKNRRQMYEIRTDF